MKIVVYDRLAEDLQQMIQEAADGYTAVFPESEEALREEGFDASYEYIVNNPYAQTWMRHDAALLVVLVSDEEDQSDDHFPVVDDFIGWYGNLRNGSVFLSSIINVESSDSACTPAPNSIDIGHRYMEATNYFGGIIVDVCSADWSAGVADASHQIEPYEEYYLTHYPDPEDSIAVFMDGALDYDWVYDSIDNKIEFLIVPDGGTLVEIGYTIEDDEYDTSS